MARAGEKYCPRDARRSAISRSSIFFDVELFTPFWVTNFRYLFPFFNREYYPHLLKCEYYKKEGVLSSIMNHFISIIYTKPGMIIILFNVHYKFSLNAYMFWFEIISIAILKKRIKVINSIFQIKK